MDKATVESVMALLNPCCVTFAKWKELGKRGRTAEEEDAALREMRDAQEAFRAEVERLAAQSAQAPAQAVQEARCACNDRPASECPGEWEPGCDLGNNPKYVRAYVDADRASSGATPADVRMLTADEQNAIIDMHNTGRAQGDHECAEAIQRAAFRVNAGKRIPADGKIGSAA